MRLRWVSLKAFFWLTIVNTLCDHGVGLDCVAMRYAHKRWLEALRLELELLGK